ncbi:MAG TPA: hypothetical protein PKZ70_08715, partial [Candidatus Atribacteria bacterium]|nr:hypothetical protein [Candidatus Atribacteria bacterium]
NYEARNDTSSVIPEWFYHLLFVTPAIFKPGSMVLKAFGFPIKDFGNDGGRGRSIRNLNYLRANAYVWERT